MNTRSSAKPVKLYNLIFPIYMICLLSPALWMVMLGGNFLIDSLILLICCKLFSLNCGMIWKKSIVRVFLFGFLSDLLGSLIYTVIMLALSPLSLYIPSYGLADFPPRSDRGVLHLFL